MRASRVLIWIAVGAAVSFVGCAHRHRAIGPSHENGAGAAAERSDVLYSCTCGPECDCGSVGLKPGNCPCGKPMVWGHVVRIENDTIHVCTCKEGCKCPGDPNDHSKCVCGNPLKKVSLKGKGIYHCNCGGQCTCNVLSDKPGECRCGMKLHQ